MKTIPKAIVTLVITAAVPVAFFFIIGLLVALIAGIMHPQNIQLELGDVFRNFFWWAIISGILVTPISFAHVFLLGLPALLLAWHFRAIHWWSVLVTSFLIGTVPTWIFVMVQNFEWHNDFGIMAVGLGVLLFVAVIMGLFGASGGFAFWIIWRYWASPESPFGRPLLLSLEVGNEFNSDLNEKNA